MTITIKHLSKHYGTQKAVDDISFQVNKGEIVGFLGPNGAGKSTTMKMITGYLAADEGEIKVCDLPVTETSTATRKKIGYLPEANPLYFEMYVKEYLYFIAGIHQIAQPKKRIDEVTATVGLLPEVHKKIGQLSKGYKQRVGLAAALLHNPDVLILDEPTSGLDPNQILEIRNVIKQLAIDKTILFSTHIMQEVEAMCSRVIIINKGKIVADGSIANLQSKNNSRQMVLVEFSAKANENSLKNISGVTDVFAEANNRYRLACENTEQVKKQLLQWSIENKLDVLSLQTIEQSLENIFRSFTQN